MTTPIVDELMGQVRRIEQAAIECGRLGATATEPEWAECHAVMKDRIAKLESRLRELLTGEAVAYVSSIHGDPEAFGEREIIPLVDIMKLRYGTKLYPAPRPFDAASISDERIDAALMALHRRTQDREDDGPATRGDMRAAIAALVQL